MNANNREWPQIKVKAMICNAPQAHKIYIYVHLRLFAFFALSFSLNVFAFI